MEYPKGTKVRAKQTIRSTDSDQLGYPWVDVPAGAVGTVTGPQMPFVNRAGSFQKVRFPQGHIAICWHNVEVI